jgi:ribonuclease-3
VADEFGGIEKRIGFSFSDKDILREALTHRSFLNEHQEWTVPHNERLEYLGDAVIELIVTEYLYQKYPMSQEGELTSFRAALVNYQMMAKVAREILLDQSLFLSRGESRDVGKARDVILANAFEALIGAIYLDGKYSAAAEFVERTLVSHLGTILESKSYKDPKSYLQEIVQEKERLTPTYRVLSESGPDHRKNFIVGVFFGDRCVTQGEGTSKQEAESSAARAALEMLEK